MTIPAMGDLLIPCLDLLTGTARNARDCLPGLQARFGLSDSEMEETIPSGTRKRVFDRADWAIWHLMKAGLVDRPERGVYRTSEAGRQLLAQGTLALTTADLRRMPAYAASMAGGQTGTPGDPPVALPIPTAGATPEETMRAAHGLIESALRDDLLAQLTDMNPIRFERLILDLLSAMGFGGGDLSRTEMTQVTGDGGIDGIIHEDALGLDRVYLQAKRYAPGNNVGSPAIYQFAGSLTARGAAKGVFVTTSDFTRDARAVAANITQHRIVLIEGQELARLLIRYGVGVRPRTTFVVSGIDEDYFSEA